MSSRLLHVRRCGVDPVDLVNLVDSWIEYDLHQVGLVRVEPVEPGRAIAERRNGGDERRDLDFSAGDQLNCPGVFSGGGTRSLQPDLARDDFLQRQRDLRGKVADQGYGAAFERKSSV